MYKAYSSLSLSLSLVFVSPCSLIPLCRQCVFVVSCYCAFRFISTIRIPYFCVCFFYFSTKPQWKIVIFPSKQSLSFVSHSRSDVSHTPGRSSCVIFPPIIGHGEEVCDERMQSFSDSQFRSALSPWIMNTLTNHSSFNLLSIICLLCISFNSFHDIKPKTYCTHDARLESRRKTKQDTHTNT